MSTPKMLTTAEVAEALGFHARTILAMVERGEFDGVAFKFGSRLRFDAAAFEAWVESKKVGA